MATTRLSMTTTSRGSSRTIREDIEEGEDLEAAEEEVDTTTIIEVVTDRTNKTRMEEEEAVVLLVGAAEDISRDTNRTIRTSNVMEEWPRVVDIPRVEEEAVGAIVAVVEAADSTVITVEEVAVVEDTVRTEAVVQGDTTSKSGSRNGCFEINK